MKKLRSILIVFVIILCIIIPLGAEAKSNAKTLAELRKELQALKNKEASNKATKNQTKSNINSATNSITNKKSEIETNTQTIKEATEESERLTKEIAEGKIELEKLVAAYQLASENNIYLEYVFNSKDYEDLVYRTALSEQVMSYVNDEIDSWNNKIEYNKELKVELANKSAQLEEDINSLSSSIEEWGNTLKQLDEKALSITDEIKSTQELIDYYKNIGCGENENLESCVAVKGDTMFIRPLYKGTVTSYYGYRISPITGKAQSFHNGTDIGGNSEGTPVYAVANGMVGKIIRKASCGGNQVFVYHTVKGVKYTTNYMHLLTINVSVGQQVSSATQIGTVGGGRGTSSYERCSTGAHLHLSLATGWYGQTYTSYSQYTSHLLDARNYINIPKMGVWFYGRY